MNCPNCQKEQADDAHECGNCGFILAKWRAARSAGAAASAPSRPVEDDGGVSAQTIALALGGLLVVAGAFWWLNRDSDDAGEAGMALGPGYCAFSGDVLDLYRLEPVKNAQLMLKPKGYARSDKAGRYYVKVKAGIPYHLALAHPSFKTSYLEGSWREASFDQRVHAARTVEKADADALDKPFECQSGEERSLTFGLIPKAVTADEKKDIDAVQ